MWVKQDNFKMLNWALENCELVIFTILRMKMDASCLNPPKKTQFPCRHTHKSLTDGPFSVLGGRKLNLYLGEIKKPRLS